MQARDVDPMLIQRPASVVDDGTALKQYWVNAHHLLGVGR